MDLGIRGKSAIVCAASKGLGKGCAVSLAAEGVNLVITARGREALEATAAELRERFGVKVTTVAGDITRPTSWSTTPAARRPATFATGTARPGSRRSMPT